MKVAYRKLKNCEGIELKKGFILRFACCDCGMVHDVTIADRRKGNHALTFRRRNRATAQFRRLKQGFLQKEDSPKYRMVKL